MAERTATRTEVPHGVIYTWSGLLNGDTGNWIEFPEYGDRCAQISGTAGVGLSITMQGTNNTSLTAFALTDPQGNAVTKTAVDVGETLMETPRYIRPSVTAGDGATNVTVTLFARRTIR